MLESRANAEARRSREAVPARARRPARTGTGSFPRRAARLALAAILLAGASTGDGLAATGGQWFRDGERTAGPALEQVVRRLRRHDRPLRRAGRVSGPLVTPDARRFHPRHALRPAGRGVGAVHPVHRLPGGYGGRLLHLLRPGSAEAGRLPSLPHGAAGVVAGQARLRRRGASGCPSATPRSRSGPTIPSGGTSSGPRSGTSSRGSPCRWSRPSTRSPGCAR